MQSDARRERAERRARALAAAEERRAVAQHGTPEHTGDSGSAASDESAHSATPPPPPPLPPLQSAPSAPLVIRLDTALVEQRRGLHVAADDVCGDGDDEASDADEASVSQRTRNARRVRRRLE